MAVSGESEGARRVERAADDLRAYRDPSWPAVAERLIARLRLVPGRRGHLRATAPSGPYDVSEAVVVRWVGDAVEAVPGAQARGVELSVTPRGELAAVRVDVAVSWQAPLDEVTAAVRTAVAAAVQAVLGERPPPEVDVVVVDVVR